jgi:hypothetical protein
MTASPEQPYFRTLSIETSRRNVLRGLLLTPIIAAVPALTACDDDDDDGAGDDATDDEVAAADDDGAGSENELPDGFPDDLPLPDQWRFQTDQSGETDEGREIVMIVFGEGDLEDFIEEMNDSIHANYEVEDEFIDEEEDPPTARWNFSDDEWVSARVNVQEYQQNRDLISVTFDMRDF